MLRVQAKLNRDIISPATITPKPLVAGSPLL